MTLGGRTPLPGFKRSSPSQGEISEIKLPVRFRARVRQFGQSHALRGEIDFRNGGRFMLLFDLARTADLR